ncbi:MAG: M23 family metallopeptidase [Oscillospiraceae bacterium]|nr:M23 family metallopeptidase [Oscillospiraceae bacterium]
MNRKDKFSKRAGDFFTGKGFYIVLILCVAVIGASAWTMLATNNETGYEMDLPVVAEVTPQPTPRPQTPGLGERPRPEPTPRPTPMPEEDETWFFGPSEPETEEPSTEPPAELPPAPPVSEQETWTPPAIQDMQFVWPVSGQVEVSYAVETLVFDRTMGDWRTHAGIDISAELGERVLAISAGTVEQVYQDDLYGTTVVIYHGNDLRSVYANLAELPPVAEGQWVEMGSVIGSVGTTALMAAGRAHHLHLEIIEEGVRVDPLNFLPERR